VSLYNPFTEDVLKIIKTLPYGSVMSYGQIALCAGHPRGARQVARLLHTMTKKHDLPWHRVVRKDGHIALSKGQGGSIQKELLLQEGVGFKSEDVVDMSKHRYMLSLDSQ